jgi:hypothetical protein
MLDDVPDQRKFGHYSMSNVLRQGIFMFICHGDSRNQMNNRAAFGAYLKDDSRCLFQEMQWAHFDTIDEVLRAIDMKDCMAGG